MRAVADVESGSIPAAHKAPWYESNLVWGPVSLGAGIVLAVIPAKTKHDLRWLLIFAWVCFWLAAFFGSRQAKLPKLRLATLTLVAAVAMAGVLLVVNHWLQMPEPAGQARAESPQATSAPNQSLSATPSPLAAPLTDEKVRPQAKSPAPAPKAPPTNPTPQQPAQNCPNGICIGGDNSGSAIVNNYGPPKLALTEANQKLLVVALKPLSGMTIRIFVHNANDDLVTLRDQLVAAFRRDNITLDPSSGEGMSFGPPPPGVSLEVGEQNKDSEQVYALARALQKVGLVGKQISREIVPGRRALGINIAPPE